MMYRYHRMSPWTRRMILSGLGILFALSCIPTIYGMVVGIEVYFPLYPAIDTRFAANYSEPQFRAIRIGMTKDEVRQRLGTPFNSVDDPAWKYSADDAYPLWDFAWLIRAVQFDTNGKVIYLSAGIAYD